MHLRIITYLILLISFSQCKKDSAAPTLAEPTPEMCCVKESCLDTFTNCIYYRPSKNMGGGFTGPLYYPLTDTSMSDPVFNPIDKNQICFTIDLDAQTPNSGKELMVLDACNQTTSTLYQGEHKNVTWCNNNWIVFTDNSAKVHKVRPNGDSLTPLFNDTGTNFAGKENPSGTLLWNYRTNSVNQGINIIDFEGNQIKLINTLNYLPIDWLNDTTLITLYNHQLFSLTIGQETIQLLNSFTFENAAKLTYSQIDNKVYAYQFIGFNMKDQLLEVSLDNSNDFNILQEYWDTHHLIPNDISEGLIIGTIHQFFAINQNMSFYELIRIGITNSTGNNERRIEF